MKNRDGRQQGAQRHAEGQHGEKAHSRFIESLHESFHEESAPAQNESMAALPDGAHRLHEDREQHDEAERNSEKNRLAREVKRNRIDEGSPQVPEALKGSPPAAK